MTDKEHIQQLLERYMASETTIDEERTLKEYFSSHDDYPEAWAAYAVMFQGMRRQVSTAKTERKSSVLKWSIGVAASLLIASLALWMLHDTENVATREVKVAKVEKQEKPAQIVVPTKLEVKANRQEAAPISAKVVAKPKLRAKTATKNTPVQPETYESVEMSDEQLMAEYIAANFMTLEERRMLETMNSDIIQQDDAMELNECINGIGIMVGNDGL